MRCHFSVYLEKRKISFETEFRKGTITRLSSLDVGDIYSIGYGRFINDDSNWGDIYLYKILSMGLTMCSVKIIDVCNSYNLFNNDVKMNIFSTRRIIHNKNRIVDKIDINEYNEKRGLI